MSLLPFFLFTAVIYQFSTNWCFIAVFGGYFDKQTPSYELFVHHFMKLTAMVYI